MSLPDRSIFISLVVSYILLVCVSPQWCGLWFHLVGSFSKESWLQVWNNLSGHECSAFSSVTQRCGRFERPSDGRTHVPLRRVPFHKVLSVKRYLCRLRPSWYPTIGTHDDRRYVTFSKRTVSSDDDTFGGTSVLYQDPFDTRTVPGWLVRLSLVLCFLKRGCRREVSRNYHFESEVKEIVFYL